MTAADKTACTDKKTACFIKTKQALLFYTDTRYYLAKTFVKLFLPFPNAGISSKRKRDKECR